ncbi:MAG: hypothetical protein AAGK04_06935 [Planctomycetota bacterium]
MRPGMIALSLAGLDRSPDRSWAGGLRRAVAWAASIGYRAVTLDATQPGIRARELDRSARRDLAATLRRLELDLAGLDLWIPASHFADPEKADRAVAAAVGAIELTADLSTLVGDERGVVSLTLPEEPDAALVALLRARADACGVQVADHTWVAKSEDRLGADRSPDEPLGVGIDPPTVLIAGGDPAAAAASLGRGLKSARLANLASGGRAPLHAADGKLDELGYLVSLSTSGYERYLVVDVRGLGDQAGAASDAARRLLPHTPAPSTG